MVRARMRGAIGLLAALLSLVPAMGVAGAGPTGITEGSATLGVGTDASALRATSCPPTRAIGAIRAGMTGIGWTTVRGDLAEPFRVRILGTLRDGIGPDRDLVIVRVSDLPGRRVVRVGGGIWSGMSGSPVYIRGRLAGAISYSLSEGASPVGGMTPARYMERLLDAPRTRTAGHADARASMVRGRRIVRISGALGESAAAEAGRSDRRALVLRRLGVPVAVSGGVGGRRSFVARQLRRRLGDVRFVATGAASTTASARLAAAPRPGQNLAGVIARGDVTVAAVGTVTAVCRGRVIGFGHPMSGEGDVAFGAARARTVTIVRGGDPYKLANIGGTFGTLDVDRLTGVRALIGRRPAALAITARVRSRTTGRVRTGRTRVAAPAWMPSVAPDHLLYDIQAVEERFGPGTAQLRWTIRGTRLDTGTDWTLTWDDRVTDGTDVAYASGLRLYAQLDALVSDPNTAVEISSVRIDATIVRSAVVDRIRRVEVSRNGGDWVRSGPVTVAGGDTLRVRVSLRARTGRTYSRIVTFEVPAGAAGEGMVHVIGGASAPTTGCDIVDGGCPVTFGGLLDGLRAAPRGDDLVVALDVQDAGGASLRLTRTVRLDHVVSGYRRLRITAD